MVTNTKMWLTVARIPAKENIEADFESRNSRRNTEWCLEKQLYQQACAKLNFAPNLFASRINYRVKPYVSYHPDPGALAVNAFHITWSDYRFYAFPPFSIISQVLQKILREKSEGLVLIPKWPTQGGCGSAMRMLIQKPVVIPAHESTLYLPSDPKERHPLHQKMKLLMCHLSGNNSRSKDFLQQLPTSCKIPGEQVPGNSMKVLCQNEDYTVVQGKLIHFLQL